MLKLTFGGLAASAASAAAAAGGRSLALHLLDPSTYPDARCNDGSRAGYYVSQPAAPSPLWIFHAQGGGW